MPNHTRIPTWLIGGAGIWLAYTITLSALHLILLDQWGVPYTIKIYSLNPSEPFSLAHAVLVAMVSPAFFLLDALSFFHIHVSWLDAAIYNWGKMALLSSLPVFLVGAMLTAQDKRLKLAGSILGLLLLGGSLLFVLSSLFTQ
jgi:energy-converting hydrogenase Eha subunit H